MFLSRYHVVMQRKQFKWMTHCELLNEWKEKNYDILCCCQFKHQYIVFVKKKEEKEENQLMSQFSPWGRK